MSRWKPDSRSRLARAALELYGERGFDNTTVAEIAARAGLTERTFFRHFEDKREVLFFGASALQDLLVETVAQTPPTLSPLEAVAAGLQAAAAVLPEREDARRRQRVITASAELKERELIKLAALAAALGTTLRARGVREPAVSLTAEVGVAVFKVAFERWLEATDGRGLAQFVDEALGEVRAVAGGA